MQPWVIWLTNHNMKFIVYIVWLLILPLFLLGYIEDAMEDAHVALKAIHNFKKV
jgi:hypothetical protein